MVQAQTCLEPIFSSNQRRLRFFNNREERILTSNSMYEFLLEENQLEENEDANSFNDVISLFCKRYWNNLFIFTCDSYVKEFELLEIS